MFADLNIDTGVNVYCVKIMSDHALMSELLMRMRTSTDLARLYIFFGK